MYTYNYTHTHTHTITHIHTKEHENTFYNNGTNNSYTLVLHCCLQSLGVSRKGQTVKALFGGGKAKAPAGPALVCVDW